MVRGNEAVIFGGGAAEGCRRGEVIRYVFPIVLLFGFSFPLFFLKKESFGDKKKLVKNRVCPPKKKKKPTCS